MPPVTANESFVCLSSFFHFFGVEKVAEYSPCTKLAVSNTQNYFQGIVKDIFEMFSRLTGISLQRESDQNFAGITGAHQSKLTNGTVYLCSFIFFAIVCNILHLHAFVVIRR